MQLIPIKPFDGERSDSLPLPSGHNHEYELRATDRKTIYVEPVIFKSISHVSVCRPTARIIKTKGQSGKYESPLRRQTHAAPTLLQPGMNIAATIWTGDIGNMVRRMRVHPLHDAQKTAGRHTGYKCGGCVNAHQPTSQPASTSHGRMHIYSTLKTLERWPEASCFMHPLFTAFAR